MASIAIVGSGISGLSAAYYLQREYDVALFEAEPRPGGHTDTHGIEIDGQTINVDTGFIVFNDRTYPNFIRLIESLGVKATATEMSFSVSGPGFEYNGHNLNTLFSQRRNLIKPSFLRMVRDILRFNRETRALSPADQALDTGTYLERQGYSEEFCHHYLLPMAAAIWSTGSDPVRQFPITALVRFFEHHGLMDLKDRPQWRVIDNGSNSYVKKIVDELHDVRLSCPVSNIERREDGVTLKTPAGPERFDYLVLAVHSDQALSMLNDPSDDEHELLSQMKYTRNQVKLHTDATIMPKRPRAWASWNYHLDRDEQQAALTYDMNRLQHLPVITPVLVTLNDPGLVDESKVIDTFEYAHPFYDHDMLAAQSRWSLISGKRRTHYAGAYWHNGFHEDGVVSALRVCRQLGVSIC
ncbi:MAG: FAD-dependent oxidoreductase [Proteobacteria bacterium]|nr:FAD-dependent oxidoreductase [Pseudomonadota bacterium]